MGGDRGEGREGFFGGVEGEEVERGIEAEGEEEEGTGAVEETAGGVE